jgi:chromosome segregation ATPase
VESALVPSRLLGELLIEKSLITPEELEEALAEQKENGKRLGEILVKKGYVSGPELTTVLAEQLGVDMEKQTGFGSGLWSEIKRRHPRGGRVSDPPEGSEAAEAETPREARLHLIDGLADAVGVMREPDVDEPEAEVESPEPDPAVEEAAALQADLDALRQQLTFAATRLDEERSAHEGTRRLLDEARVAQALAGAADPAEHTDPAQLAELNDTIVSLRAELEARDTELAASVDARAELESVMAELESDLHDLRERRSGSDAASAELADKVRELRVENDEVRRRLIESRAAATAAKDELAAVKAELDARTAELAAASETHDTQLTELRSEADLLSQALDEERASHAAAHRDVERLESRCAELEAAKAAAESVQSEVAKSLEKEHKDAVAVLEAKRATLRAKVDTLSQSLEKEQAAHAAARQEIERLEARRAELEPLEGRLAQANTDLDARKQTISDLTAEVAAAQAALEGARQAIERRESRTAALTAELEAVRAELAERPEPPPVEEPPSAHVVFLQGAEGYVLEVRPGPAPEVGTEEELDGVHLRVARIGRSPLPADQRRCVFLEVA